MTPEHAQNSNISKSFEAAVYIEELSKPTKEKRAARKKERRVVPHGVAHVQATFNNTLVTICDPEGGVLAWSSAGRSGFSDELQALCFFAGANSIFHGEKLLTTGNPDTAADRRLFERLKLKPEEGLAAG